MLWECARSFLPGSGRDHLSASVTGTPARSEPWGKHREKSKSGQTEWKKCKVFYRHCLPLPYGQPPVYGALPGSAGSVFKGKTEGSEHLIPPTARENLHRTDPDAACGTPAQSPPAGHGLCLIRGGTGWDGVRCGGSPMTPGTGRRVALPPRPAVRKAACEHPAHAEPRCGRPLEHPRARRGVSLLKPPGDDGLVRQRYPSGVGWGGDPP